MPGYSQEWADDFLRRNPGDNARLQSAWDSNNTSSQGRQFDSQGPMYDQRTNQLSAAGQAALRQRQTLGTMTGLRPYAAPVSRTMPVSVVPPPQGNPAVTLGDWLQMTSNRAPDWRYLSGRS